MSIVVGIDPGSHSAGIAVVEDEELKFSTTVDSLTGAVYGDDDLAAYMVSFMLEVQDAIDKYEPELIVIELTSVPTNMHTNKLLAYWEACAIIAAGMSNIDIKRMRTKQARKTALGSGKLNKKEVIWIIKNRYQNQDLTDDEAEAIVFALAGKNLLE